MSNSSYRGHIQYMKVWSIRKV